MKQLCRVIISLDSESEQVKPESPSSVKTKIFRLFGRQRPVHQVFGGGKPPAEFFLAIAQLIEGNEFLNVNVIVVSICWLVQLPMCYCGETRRFQQAFLGVSPPRIPQVQILEDPFLQVVSALTIEINRGFAVLRDIASGKDLKKFLMIIHLLCSQEFDMRRDSTSKGLVRWGETHYSNHRFPMVDSFHEHLTVFEAVPLAKPLDNIGLKIDTPPAAPEKDKLIVLYWLIRLKEIGTLQVIPKLPTKFDNQIRTK
ncbi:hypothetical protein F8388_014106 [Cannabis sativa]|uniref:Reticulon domain-containing protein n=1 Tax=Cannabis sativa TaxID=3483 RepID=A0A7J6GL01_CANSA|nr:hypothetical protein F8388_014106 [Cannabis sativa]